MFECKHKGNKKDCFSMHNIEAHKNFIATNRFKRYWQLKNVILNPEGYAVVCYLDALVEESKMCIACAKKAGVK